MNLKNPLTQSRYLRKIYLTVTDKNFWTQTKTHIIVAAGCFVLSLFAYQSGSTVNATPVGSIDTHIPAGYVLVPIEIANHRSLNRVLGSYGIVDLYDSRGSSRGRLVARRLKILRSPMDPNIFAILVPMNDAAALVGENRTFTVVVQNPNQGGTHFVTKTAKSISRTIIEDGEGQ